jgi:hypothetical protein
MADSLQKFTRRTQGPATHSPMTGRAGIKSWRARRSDPDHGAIKLNRAIASITAFKKQREGLIHRI